MVWTVYLRWHGTVVPVGTGYQTRQEAVDAIARHNARTPEASANYTVKEELSGDPAEDDDDDDDEDDEDGNGFEDKY